MDMRSKAWLPEILNKICLLYRRGGRILYFPGEGVLIGVVTCRFTVNYTVHGYHLATYSSPSEGDCIHGSCGPGAGARNSCECEPESV